MKSLVIQLARLGDLMQTLPAIASLGARKPHETLDLLCGGALAAIVSLFPGIDRVLPWDADRWRRWVGDWPSRPAAILAAGEAYLREISASASYDRAYNLNQHPRAILAAHLLAGMVVGPGYAGPISEDLPAWHRYLRQVARERRPNHVHLSDIFCGMCGVRPPGVSPTLSRPAVELPSDLGCIGDGNARWIGVIVGAGDLARCLPPLVWAQWITRLLDADPDCRVVLIGTGGELARARAIREGLPPLLLGRLWDASGRTDLLQLASLLGRCQWVTGSDTGSLHLAAAVGTRTMGFYFARARVHETGPYGEGHWIWQAPDYAPATWPVVESVSLVLERSEEHSDVPEASLRDGWQLWKGHVDEWGASYSRAGERDSSRAEREQVWRDCMGDPQAAKAVARVAS
ncbi:MAG TPA: glycosyltransferase family 9 protein [Nitrospira sp.]|nr:glycosyltransferase family 9 protein [Nitrospira sp.]